MMKKRMQYRNRQQIGLADNERGFASLIIGLILVLVLALMTVGFAQLSRHEQQQALSHQLASQAYYAAETGVNDAYYDITHVNPVTGNTYINAGNASNTACMQETAVPATAKTAIHTIDTNAGTSYSCLLVQLTTPDLQFKKVGPGTGQSIITSTTSPLGSIDIAWSSNVGPKSPAPGKLFPSIAAAGPTWTYPAVIQFSVTPLSNLTRAGLISNTFTPFLYPSAGGASAINYSAAPSDPPLASTSGTIVSGACSPTGACKATINNLPAAGSYLIHFLVYYDTTDLTITGRAPGGLPVSFNGGQAQIDVTGKAQNVLKRLVVRVHLGSNIDAAEYGLQAKYICKRMVTQPGPAGTTTFIDNNNQPIVNPGSSDPCNLEN